MLMDGTPSRLPPLTALAAFEAVARRGSFTRAAAELNLTQGAVSHRIRSLEAALGRPLLQRHHRRVEPTAEGAAYLPVVRGAFEMLAEGTRRIFGGTGTVLTVSVEPGFAMFWLIPRLGRFQAAHPEVELRLTTTAQEGDLARGRIDAGIRYGDGRWPGLVAERLFAYEMIPVCSPGLAAGPSPLGTPADLAGHTLLHAQSDLADWGLWLAAAGVEGVDGTRGPRFDSTSLALTAAGDGLGVAIAPYAFVRDDLEDGWLVAPFAVTVAADAFYLVHPPATADHPGLAAFGDWLASEAARDAAEDAAENPANEATVAETRPPKTGSASDLGDRGEG